MEGFSPASYFSGLQSRRHYPMQSRRSSYSTQARHVWRVPRRLIRKEPNMNLPMSRWFALLLPVLWFVPAGAADPDTEIACLVKQLSSDRFKERQAATKRLTEIGEPAL